MFVMSEEETWEGDLEILRGYFKAILGDFRIDRKNLHEVLIQQVAEWAKRSHLICFHKQEGDSKPYPLTDLIRPDGSNDETYCPDCGKVIFD